MRRRHRKTTTTADSSPGSWAEDAFELLLSEPCHTPSPVLHSFSVFAPGRLRVAPALQVFDEFDPDAAGIGTEGDLQVAEGRRLHDELHARGREIIVCRVDIRNDVAEV